MSIRLLAAGSGRVDLGDIATFDNLAALSEGVWIDIIAFAEGRRVFGKWHPAAGSVNRQFLASVINTDELQIVVGEGGSGGEIEIWRTTTVGLTTGLHRFMVTWEANGVATTGICFVWVDGVKHTPTLFSTSTPEHTGVGTSAFQIAYETASAVAGIDGDYAEYCHYAEVVPEDFSADYTTGDSPDFYLTNRLHYIPMLAIDDLVDEDGNCTPTQTGGTTQTHPPVNYPGGGPTIVEATADGGLTLGGSVAGRIIASAVASGGLTLQDDVLGKAIVGSIADGGLQISGDVAGGIIASAIAEGGLQISGDVAGRLVVSAVAAGGLTVSGSAIGKAVISAQAAGGITISGDVIAEAVSDGIVEAVAGGGLTLGGEPIGQVIAAGAASGGLEISGQAIGALIVSAIAEGGLEISGDAVAASIAAGVAEGGLAIGGSVTAQLLGARKPALLDVTLRHAGRLSTSLRHAGLLSAALRHAGTLSVTVRPQ